MQPKSYKKEKDIPSTCYLKKGLKIKKKIDINEQKTKNIERMITITITKKSHQVAFFQRVRFVFQISQSPQKIIPKNYSELEIWISCLLIWARISNLKLRIVFWNNIFGRLGDFKNESHFLKKGIFKGWFGNQISIAKALTKKEEPIVVAMLGFYISFFEFESGACIKKRHAKTEHHNICLSRL